MRRCSSSGPSDGGMGYKAAIDAEEYLAKLSAAEAGAADAAAAEGDD